MKKVFDIDLPEINTLLHHTQIGLNALHSIGITLPDIPPKPQLFIDDLSEIKYQNFINKLKKKYVLINLSAGNSIRMPEIKFWINFIKSINTSEYHIILNAAPSEHEIALEIMKNTNDIYYFSAENIRDTFPFIKNALILISPDTALVHIASAFNTPILALYSGLNDSFAKFHPLSDIQVIVRSENGDKGVKSISSEQILSGFYKIMNLLNI
jgi:ADP-heptose:LPS heptosyltransferase